jgi:two-component system cell cycle sensor histidine kinase/response regulator CckA
MDARILIVDDMHDNVEAFESVLRTYIPELEIHTAENGAQALDVAMEVLPDVVLLDVHMPEMDGFEVCRRLKTDARTADIPVLMVSAFMTRGHHRALGLDIGADGYLCKPFDTAELVAQVRGLMRIKRNEDALRAKRHELEGELETRTKTLRMSEEHWRSLFDASPDAIFIEDLEGNVLEANPAACALHEMTHDELVGTNVLDLVPPDERKKIAVAFSRRTDRTLHTYEGSSYTKAGRAVPVEVRATTFEYRNQPAILLHVRDISDRLRMEQDMTQVQKLESVGVLAGGIAHDFNNILTGVIGNISVAKLEIPKDSGAYEPICEAEKSAFRARLLTQQLLTFAKGGSPVRRTSSVAQLLKEATAFVLSGSRSTCRFDIEDDLWPAEIDVGQISQVIENLVINASQAMPQGGTIRMTARNTMIDEAKHERYPKLNKGRYIEVIIQDEGGGISAEDMPRVFDPYFTTKKGGSGLGLATSYSIVHKHEGLMTVESELGHGATFTLVIPASDKPLPEKPEVGERPIPGKGRILVMDDEMVIRKILEAALDKLGYTSASVSDGQAALEAYQQAMRDGEPFDAVILDITVPGGMGGEEAIELLKAVDPEVKGIVSSGYTTGGAMSMPELLGFRGVIAKPYSIQQLSQVLHTVLTSEA